MTGDDHRYGDYREGLPPEGRLRIIAQLWNEIRISGYYGKADGVVVDQIERQVTEAMYRDPPDVDRAESLTFKAILLIGGDI